MGRCIFCDIALHKIPSQIVHETEELIGFKDIHPQAPVHVLLAPKKHLSGVEELDPANPSCIADLVAAANQIAGRLGLTERGFRLVINSKTDGGQTVDHLHLHLLGGRKMNWPPG